MKRFAGTALLALSATCTSALADISVGPGTDTGNVRVQIAGTGPGGTSP